MSDSDRIHVVDVTCPGDPERGIVCGRVAAEVVSWDRRGGAGGEGVLSLCCPNCGQLLETFQAIPFGRMREVTPTLDHADRAGEESNDDGD